MLRYCKNKQTNQTQHHKKLDIIAHTLNQKNLMWPNPMVIYSEVCNNWLRGFVPLVVHRIAALMTTFGALWHICTLGKNQPVVVIHNQARATCSIGYNRLALSSLMGRVLWAPGRASAGAL